MRRIAFLCLATFLLPVGTASVQQPTGASQPSSDVSRSLQALNAILESLDAKKETLETRKEEIRTAKNADHLARLKKEVGVLQAEIAALNRNFQSVATGININEFDSGLEESFNLQAELESLLRPLIEELKDATESPRQIEHLRTELAYHEHRRQLATAAISQLQNLVEQAGDAGVRENLQTAVKTWTGRRRDIANAETVARYHLQSRLGQQKSLIESTRNVLALFFRSRGLNLLSATGAFLVVFLGLRFLSRSVGRVGPLRRRRRKHTFYRRLVRVLFHVFAALAALFASLLVLYIAGDWVLLGLAILFLLGLAWASKQALPQFFEQIRLLLNLGTVRDNERMVYEGIPWRVGRLNFYTCFTNPDLTGGLIRLPLRALSNLHSRPCSADEAWFPCREGEWVKFDNDHWGKVVLQTPEMVQLEMLGGSVATYTTTNFLARAPENLSRGFRLSVTFGIDYRHQAVSVSEVPGVMQAALEPALTSLVGDGGLAKLLVEFKEAGTSSLDYAVQADFTGEAAPGYESLQRAIQATLVTVCNDRDWGIPFTQITLHQAE